MSTTRDEKEDKAMANANIREAHKLLDRLDSLTVLSKEQAKLLRSFLPELPKQKTLEELRQEVYDAWVGANGNEWPCIVHGNLEIWLIELYDQLKGLAPEHPEFLETEADYEEAPVGTIVTMDGVGCAWVKEQQGWIGARQYAASSSLTMAGTRCRVLRWGWGE